MKTGEDWASCGWLRCWLAPRLWVDMRDRNHLLWSRHCTCHLSASLESQYCQTGNNISTTSRRILISPSHSPKTNKNKAQVYLPLSIKTLASERYINLWAGRSWLSSELSRVGRWANQNHQLERRWETLKPIKLVIINWGLAQHTRVNTNQWVLDKVVPCDSDITPCTPRSAE